MKLPRLAVDNYQFTIMLFVVLGFAGVFSFFKMPRTENPSIDIPGASVLVIYPGASPNDLEQLVAIPLEEAINELEDIKKIETTIRDGLVNIGVEFFFNTDAKEKYDEVVSEVNSVKNELPDDIYSLDVLRWSTADVNIMQLALVSDRAEYAELEARAEDLKKDIEKIQGIRKVELHAFPEQEIRITADPEKMALMNITLDQVAGALIASNTIIPGGNIVLGNKNFTLKSNGPYQDMDEIENTVISSNKGQLIHLRDIALVELNYEDVKYIGRFEGKRAVFVTAQQKEGLNLFEIEKEIKSTVRLFTLEMPDYIEVQWIFDQAFFVNNRINGFLINLLQGIFLVGVVIFLAMGYRSSLITMMAVPLSIVIGIWVIHASGFGLQQISIAGMVVALGMLVDNSIVMMQNINRFLSMGYSKREAAIKGAEQIGWPVVSSTLTTVAAFIPIILMKDEAGEFIKSLPVAIIATLMASLLIALTITPYLAARVLIKPETGNHQKGFMKWTHWIIQNPYRKTLDIALRNKRNTLLITGGVLLVSVFIFVEFIGISFFPKAEQPQFLIRLDMPEGTDIKKTDRAARYVESILDTLPGVVHFATNVGHGNPRIYYNAFTRSYAGNFAEFYIRLDKYEASNFDRMVEQLRSLFSKYPAGEISVKEFEQGTPVLAPVVITLLGENIAELKRISSDIEAYMQKVNGVVNCENELSKTKSDLYITINKEKASYFGVPVAEIDRTIRAYIGGARISSFRDKEGNEFHLVVRMPANDSSDLNNMNKIYVKSLSGKQIPLFQLASLGFKEAPGLITRTGLQRSANITADIKTGITLDEVLGPVMLFLENYDFPAGISYTIGGELENRQKSFGGMIEALIIATLVIFAILVLQFRSFAQPLIIFAAVPLAFIGAIWAWFLTGNTFSFTAFIGLISLIGIVVNNSILLVDYSNKLMAEGKNVTEAVKESGETRFIPVILTSFTTIGGLLPLTIGGGTLWAPLAWGIIGGLLTSTLLTLIITPVIYDLVTANNKENEK